MNRPPCCLGIIAPPFRLKFHPKLFMWPFETQLTNNSTSSRRYAALGLKKTTKHLFRNFFNLSSRPSRVCILINSYSTTFNDVPQPFIKKNYYELGAQARDIFFMDAAKYSAGIKVGVVLVQQRKSMQINSNSWKTDENY